MYIVNPNLPEGRVQVLPSKKKLSELPDDAQIFSKNQILNVMQKDPVQHPAMENILF